MILETLEDRIAPASATFVDADGDVITVMTSKGTAQNIMDVVTGGANSEIENIALKDNNVFKGSSLKVYVSSKASGGDGLANVWKVDATGIDLSSIEVNGDLAKVLAGDGNYANGSVKTIKVQSVGLNGGAADKAWLLKGYTTTFASAGSVNGASLIWDNPDANGKLTITSLSIGGSLIGGATDDSGVVVVKTGAGGTAEIKTLNVGGGLTATNYHRSGSVLVGDTAMPDTYFGKIGKATIGGSLTGFAAKMYSGTLYTSTSLGETAIGGSLIGGGEASGSIFSYNAINGPVKIGGLLDGGAGNYSGAVFANYKIGSVEIGGSVDGGAGSYSGSVTSTLGSVGNVKIGSFLSGSNGFHAGAIYGKTGVGNVWIGGSVFGGSNDYAGSIATQTMNGDTYAIGDVTIMGDLTGGSDFTTGQITAHNAGNIFISGKLDAGSVAGSGSIILTNAFKSLYIGGDIEGGNTNFAGSVRALGDGAKIDSVTIGGSLLGNDGLWSGGIDIDGAVTTFSIGGHVLGGQGTSSAAIDVDGAVSKLTIGGNIVGSATMGTDSAYVQLADVMNAAIGGSITGGANTNSGSVDLGSGNSLVIGGGVTGGSASSAGTVVFGTFKTLSVGTGHETGVSIYGGDATGTGYIAGSVSGSAKLAGSIVGGSGGTTGFLQLIFAKDVTIGGNIQGGAGVDSGYFFSNGSVTGKLIVGGSVYGSDDVSNTGYIKVSSAKSIEVKGSLIGGDATMANKVNTGYISAGGAIDSLTIGGNIIGGNQFNSTNVNLGGVRAGTIGTMLVKGDILGQNSEYVNITAQGDITKTSGTNLAIKSLTVNGNMNYVNILGGYDQSGSTLDGAGGNDGGSAQLGTITVLGNFFNSTIATGVSNDNTAVNHWADGNNVLLAKPTGSNIVASIAKIVIKGASFANVQNGVAAELVKSLSFGGSNVPVPAGAQNFQISGGNYKVQQVVA